jgi:hypothetical protein
MCSLIIQNLLMLHTSLRVLKFLYRGIFYASSNATSLGPMFSSWSLNMGARSSCSMPCLIHDVLEYASTDLLQWLIQHVHPHLGDLVL